MWHRVSLDKGREPVINVKEMTTSDFYTLGLKQLVVDIDEALCDLTVIKTRDDQFEGFGGEMIGYGLVFQHGKHSLDKGFFFIFGN